MFYGWKLLVGLCGIYFLTTGSVFYGFGVVLPAMIADMGWSRTEASVGFSVLALVVGMAGPVVAMAIKRFGARRTIALGGVMAAAGAISVYFTTSLLQYYLSVGFLVGIGMAMQTVIPGTQLVTNWFARRRALALGIFMAMGGAGAFVAAPAFAYLVEISGNWRLIWAIMALNTLISSIIALIIVRDRPEDVGTFTDGIDPDAAPVTPAGTTVRKQVHQTAESWEVRNAIRTLPFWLIIAAATFVVAGGTIVNSQGVIHLQDLGIDTVTAGAALGTVGMLGACGRLMTGLLGDRFDPRFMLGGGLVVELLAVLLFNFATTEPLAYLFAVLFGAGNGMAVVASPALVANYFGHKNYAAIIGIRGLIITPVAAIGPLIAAASFDMVGSYGPVFYGFALLAVIPAVAALLMRPPVPKVVSAVTQTQTAP